MEKRLGRISLTKEQLEAIQKDDPEVIVGTISQEQWDHYGTIVKEVKESLPIQQQTDEGLELFKEILERNRRQQEFVEKLEYTSLKAAIQNWLQSMHNRDTQRNYAYYIEDLIRRLPGVFPEFDAKGNAYTVGHFKYQNHKQVLDYIYNETEWAEGTRKLRAACYVSLTTYLREISYGWFPRVHLSYFENNNNKALSLNEWYRFIDALHSVNKRDALIAYCMLQGMGISSVLDLKLDQIDLENNTITFKQLKNQEDLRELSVQYPAYFIDELRNYIKSTIEERKNSEWVFVTRNSKRLTRSRCNYIFSKASEVARIKNVTPFMLRVTWMVLTKEKGVAITDIIKKLDEKYKIK